MARNVMGVPDAGDQPAPSAADSWPTVLTVEMAHQLSGLSEQVLRHWLRHGAIRGTRAGRRWHMNRDEFLLDITHLESRGPA